MKIIVIDKGVKIRFDCNEFASVNLMASIYSQYSKSTKELIELLVNHPTNTLFKIALRLKKGEKLDVYYVNDFNKLTLYYIHQFTKSKYKKYIHVYNNNYTCSNDDVVIINDEGYKFKPNTETWYRESKLLNEENFKKAVDDYSRDLYRELSKFESMVSYTEYKFPEYYNGGNIKYDEISVNGKLMKVSKQCIDYIKSNNFTEAEANDIIFDDINNLFVYPSVETINLIP